ncbi:hypothetical protein JTE90_014056 [Oedothorax gibbosus]|uniref:Protein kinase domain-containing protein n=1 Tax=Oedothorax gibbosus TaxID=931172 RepID=A0AAV6V247_9ARAC|nr:hypothetical protein JTE90_014056 [Oedothorax gibbosus]
MPINQVGRTRIGKFYELTDTPLGKGSFSKVYLAHHILFGNKVALKVIDRNQIEEDYVLKNLTREASILRKLKHPNIVNFYEDLSHEQLYCLSLELVEGSDLSQFLNRQPSRRVSEKFAKTLFYQMVSAVRYMHKANVLHRDLKQENILLEHGKVIKIVDFGLSNVRYPFKRLLTHCGSLEYAAPELFMRSSVYGPGVDLWSLGVILFSMVTGQMPFAVPRWGDATCAPEHKDVFYRRISQGLTKENWKVMRNLSTDCCHLLENLLQPNQFKRSDIRDVYVHPWLQKDPNLKKNLPRFRPDLKHRYKPQVMNWMADKLGVPQRRIQVHLAIYKFETISAIYNMLLDILVKKELYFPAHISNTFTFRMNQREISTFYDTVGDSSLTAELCKDPVSKKIETGQVVQTKEKIGDSETKESCRTRAEDIPNQWGDGGRLTRRSKGSPILKSNHTFTKIDDELTGCFKMIGKNDTVILSHPIEDKTSTLVKKPFRSYKLNRPLKAMKTSRDVEQDSLDWHNNSGKELKKDPIETNENLDTVSISSSIALNYQRNLKLLNEKYRLKSHLPSKPIKNVTIKEMVPYIFRLLKRNIFRKRPCTTTKVVQIIANFEEIVVQEVIHDMMPMQAFPEMLMNLIRNPSFSPVTMKTRMHRCSSNTRLTFTELNPVIAKEEMNKRILNFSNS